MKDEAESPFSPLLILFVQVYFRPLVDAGDNCLEYSLDSL